MMERHHVFPDADAPGTRGQEKAATFQEATRRFQEQLLRSCLEETGWNVSETARRLDVARSHVYKLITAFGFERLDDGA